MNNKLINGVVVGVIVILLISNGLLFFDRELNGEQEQELILKVSCPMNWTLYATNITILGNGNQSFVCQPTTMMFEITCSAQQYSIRNYTITLTLMYGDKEIDSATRNTHNGAGSVSIRYNLTALGCKPTKAHSGPKNRELRIINNGVDWYVQCNKETRDTVSLPKSQNSVSFYFGGDIVSLSMTTKATYMPAPLTIQILEDGKVIKEITVAPDKTVRYTYFFDGASIKPI